MPTPLPAAAPGERATFDAAEVERWLAHHPRLLKDRAAQTAADQLRAGATETAVVKAARAHGLAWAHIATILTDHDRRPRTVPGLSRFYHRRGIT